MHILVGLLKLIEFLGNNSKVGGSMCGVIAYMFCLGANQVHFDGHCGKQDARLGGHLGHVYTSQIAQVHPRIIPVHQSDTQGILGAGRDDPSIFLG